MTTTTPLLFSLLTLTLLLPPTTSIPLTTITTATEILINTNHTATSLTLPLLTTLLDFPSLPSATLFSAFDTAFSSLSSGQPPLSLLKLHFCPLLYTPSDLLSLPYGSHLPTLLPNYSLTITSTIFDDFLSVNGVKINTDPVFDDGFLIIYAVDKFFAKNFVASYSVSELSPGPSYTNSVPECRVRVGDSGGYWEASAALRTRGYSLMAGFLDVQVSQFDEGSSNVITVFAPKDEVLEGYFRNYSDWGSFFLRHVVGCELTWSDIVLLNDGNVLRTLLKGFGIKIGKDDKGNLVFDGNLTVDFPDFYRGDRILVHGLSGILTVTSTDGKSGDDQDGGYGGSSSSSDIPNVVLMAASDHGEF